MTVAKILLVETDWLLGANLSHFFENLGHEVIWRVEAQEAMDEADNCQPDIVVLDLILAGSSSIEFLYEFRSYPEWQSLPVVMFSDILAEELTGYINAFEQLGISAYCYRPTTSLKQLNLTVNDCLQLARV